MRNLLTTGFVAMGLALVAPVAQGQTDSTVRTGSFANTGEVSAVVNARNMYEQVVNTITGRFSVVNQEMVTATNQLEEVRRRINNIQTVTYRTEVVYVDQPVYGGGDGGWQGGGDDGGGGGGDGGGGGGCG
jgi:uncharacterized membrane protein YgcG